METLCVCGGGSLGHVISGYLSARKHIRVNMLTQRPESWNHILRVHTPEGEVLQGCLHCVTDNPDEALHDASIVLLCLPGYAIRPELERIRPHVRPGTYVGTVFSSTGFFFEALSLLDSTVPLWGFQRVPFIARTLQYGSEAQLLGYKPCHRIAVERSDDKEAFRTRIEELFDAPVQMLRNYYEASFTNSNPILHPSRLYTMFRDWTPGMCYSHRPLFYEEWTDEASALLIELDRELFSVLAHLPVSPDFLMPILPYYESANAAGLTRKIRSIAGFKGIVAPMQQTASGWRPDLSSRYFQEDFLYGLRYIWQEAHRLDVSVPRVDEVYAWGMALLSADKRAMGKQNDNN